MIIVVIVVQGNNTSYLDEWQLYISMGLCLPDSINLLMNFQQRLTISVCVCVLQLYKIVSVREKAY